jgi:hypothetical protein
MEKAYDLKDLGEKLKAKGLPIAEDMLEKIAGEVYLAVKAWAKESAPLSETKVDDFVSPFYDQLDAIVLPLIDKIDGKQGE